MVQVLLHPTANRLENDRALEGVNFTHGRSLSQDPSPSSAKLSLRIIPNEDGDPDTLILKYQSQSGESAQIEFEGLSNSRESEDKSDRDPADSLIVSSHGPGVEDLIPVLERLGVEQIAVGQKIRFTAVNSDALEQNGIRELVYDASNDGESKVELSQLSDVDGQLIRRRFEYESQGQLWQAPNLRELLDRALHGSFDDVTEYLLAKQFKS